MWIFGNFLPHFIRATMTNRSGIGLSYAKALVEIHGGKIGAFDNEDRGASFYFELPVNTVLEETSDTAIQLYDNGNCISIPEENVITQISTENYTVLIVEDKLELRLFLKMSYGDSRLFIRLKTV